MVSVEGHSLLSRKDEVENKHRFALYGVPSSVEQSPAELLFVRFVSDFIQWYVLQMVWAFPILTISRDVRQTWEKGCLSSTTKQTIADRCFRIGRTVTSSGHGSGFSSLCHFVCGIVPSSILLGSFNYPEESKKSSRILLQPNQSRLHPVNHRIDGTGEGV